METLTLFKHLDKLIKISSAAYVLSNLLSIEKAMEVNVYL